jgi:hypothetical protein
MDEISQRIAAAADLCLKPHRHAVVGTTARGGSGSDGSACQDSGDPADCCLRLQPRGIDGERLPLHDIELELYRSGNELHIVLSWPEQPEQPMLWHGQHPVWMDGETGLRTERPPAGASLEGLARRLRALLSLPSTANAPGPADVSGRADAGDHANEHPWQA